MAAGGVAICGVGMPHHRRDSWPPLMWSTTTRLGYKLADLRLRANEPPSAF